MPRDVAARAADTSVSKKEWAANSMVSIVETLLAAANESVVNSKEA